jgi:DNA-binding LacI/PurR family transcriptional regulator
MLSSGFLDPKRERGAIETMLELRVDGLIMLGSMMQVAKIERFAAALPVTVVGRHTRSKVVDSIGVDNSAGAQQAVDHLVELGHTRIAHIHAGAVGGSPRRRGGYERAMRRHGLEEHIRLVEGAFTEAGGTTAMNEILEAEDIPTAVFAPNDVAAIGAMEAIDAAGLAIPGDISLVGYDNLALAALPRIGLTTVGQPRVDLGRQAVGLVLERLDEGRERTRHVLIPPQLVVRSTTGPPPGR